MKVLSILPLLFFYTSNFHAMDLQDSNHTDSLPYRVIPDHPETFTASTVVSRLLDGLGFRYYWATEGLRNEDLDYHPSAESRSSRETLEHIFGLVRMVRNTVLQQSLGPDASPVQPQTFTDLRRITLEMIEETAKALNDPQLNLEERPIVFTRGDRTTTYPFWNQLNGPIADALWHVGQIVSFRRASGNPLNSRASMFTGTIRE